MASRESGAAGRKRRRAAANAALDEEFDDGSAYDVLGLPDVKDPSTALDYVRKAQLIAFGEVCRSKTLPQRERWKLIREMGAVIGMTHNRADLESRTKNLEAKLNKEKPVGAVRFEPGSKVAKPPTARGGARGPRSLTKDQVADE